jgi:hypothetical protein
MLHTTVKWQKGNVSVEPPLASHDTSDEGAFFASTPTYQLMCTLSNKNQALEIF